MHGTTVDREYFDITKVTWAKCLISFNFINLAYEIYLTLDILLHKVFPHYVCARIVIEIATYEMQSWLPCL